MPGSKRREERATRRGRGLGAAFVVVTMLAAALVTAGLGAESVGARGPAYPGPQTTAEGPAFFGPAPNPFPYCDSPTYFDAWDENVTPTGRLDVGDSAAVTTNGMTLVLEIQEEGDPGGQYPGFFPFNGEGSANDRAKGFEVAAGDSATLTLSQPLFYAQFIFTDVDQPGEGFEVIPDWAIVGEVIAYGGDGQFTFEGTTNQRIVLDDLDGVSHPSESVEGRAQLDMLGAVDGITITRPATRIDPDTGQEVPAQGQSGLSVAGGCEASGAAKRVVSGPTWNGESFEVSYELRLRNNMPTEQTILDVVQTAQANAQTTFSTAPPTSIALDEMRLRDQLADPAFSTITVTDVRTSHPDLVLNDEYNGLDDDELLASGSFLSAESDAVISLTVEYTPDETLTEWVDCQNGYDYLNQSEVSGTVAGIFVSDLSDDGADPTPSSNNGSGDVDDPTPVLFPCLPANLDVVKTAVPGPDGACPTFANGVSGDGPTLPLLVGDVVTYCISVENNGLGTAADVTIADAQAPGSFPIGALETGQGQTVSYDLQVGLATPGLNVATATGTSVLGDLGPVSDTARISVSPQPEPDLQIVKTVLPGPNAVCPDFDSGVPGRGTPLPVADGDVVTYCISVRNEGTGDAVDVVVSDDQAPQDFAVGTLATTQSATVFYDVTVSLATPTVNVASADGDGPDGRFEQVSDDAEIDVAPLQPDLEIVKTALLGPDRTCPVFAAGVPGPGDPLSVTDGDIVTYCVSVINSGLGIATNVAVFDEQAPAPFNLGTLISGGEQTVSYEVGVTLQTPTTNTAMANGDGPDGALVEVSDDAVLAIGRLPQPQLEIVKTAVRGANATCPDFVGGTPNRGAPVQFVETETVTYCLTVRNVGEGAATNVALSDDQAPNAFDLAVGNLAAGAEATRSFEVTVSLQTPTVNIAFADGDGPYGPVRQVNDEAEIAVSLQPDPVLEIVKTVVEGPDGTCPDFANGVDGDGAALPVLYGDVVTYCLAVTNRGENDAQSVRVGDPQAPGVFSIGVVPVGEEVLRSYDITVDEQTAARNTATVTGVGPNGQLPDHSDSALIDASPQPDPVLEIVKTVVDGPNGTCPSFDAGVVGDGDPLTVFYGDVVTYCISVRNEGERAATGVLVTDAQAPQTYDLGTLQVDDVVTVSYDILVEAQTEERNIATVTGQGPNGDLPEGSDTALIDPSPQPDPQLNIVKTVVLGPDGSCPSFDDGITGLGHALSIDVGDTVTYCLSIRNTGARDAQNVVIADEQAPQAYAIGTLAVGETVDRSYDVVVAADTPLVNLAVVTGEGPNGELPEDDDDARITTADIELVHTVVRTDRDCESTVEDVDILVVDLKGLDILWCYRITNTGNVPLTNIALSSPDIGFLGLDVLENAGASFTVGTSGDLILTESAPLVPTEERRTPVNSANVEPGSLVLLPGESVPVAVTTSLPEGGLISNADVLADPADVDGNLLGLPQVKDVDDSEVREGLIQLDKTVAVGADADCATAGELVVVAQGEPVTWCFTVTNIGTLDLQVDDIVDDTLDISVSVPDGLRVLEPTANFTVATNGVSRGAVINLASVEGLALDPDGQVIEQAPAVRDEDTAEIRLPAEVEEIDPRVEYPGPFTISDPPADPPDVPDEVLGLAITGSASLELGLLAALMLMIGALLLVGSRRSRERTID